jgi:hypothetical protein
LTGVVAAAVRDLASHLRGTPVALLAVDCHPWNGSLGLAVLTASEADADSLLADPSEMAAWQHFQCAAGLPAWGPAADLGREMRAAYTAAADRRATVDQYLRACAAAMANPEVAAAVELLDRDRRFRVSVAHPDDGREFYPPSE